MIIVSHHHIAQFLYVRQGIAHGNRETGNLKHLGVIIGISHNNGLMERYVQMSAQPHQAAGLTHIKGGQLQGSAFRKGNSKGKPAYTGMKPFPDVSRGGKQVQLLHREGMFPVKGRNVIRLIHHPVHHLLVDAHMVMTGIRHLACVGQSLSPAHHVYHHILMGSCFKNLFHQIPGQGL